MTTRRKRVIPYFWRKITYFKPEEFACKKCLHENRFLMKADIELVTRINYLRSECIQAPVYISSGYRCRKHNIQVGGADKSSHLTGLGADIYVNHIPLHRFWYIVQRTDLFHGIGIYPETTNNVIHVDLLPRKASWVCVGKGKRRRYIKL